MSTFLAPPRWSPETLEREVAAAVESFRREREREPLDQYPAHVDECLGTMEELIELTVDLSQLRERAVRGRHRRRACSRRCASSPGRSSRWTTCA